MKLKINVSVDQNADEESEEPPKPDVKEVKEDDAFYSKKYVEENFTLLVQKCCISNNSLLMSNKLSRHFNI